MRVRRAVIDAYEEVGRAVEEAVGVVARFVELAMVLIVFALIVYAAWAGVNALL